jgi:dihydrofolate synthase / folylpolyglutamate synthase
MRDKNLEGLARALAPAAAHIICTAAGSPRAAAPETLAAIFRLAAPERPVTIEHDPLAALRQAVALDTPAVVAGSLYLAGEIRAHLS